MLLIHDKLVFRYFYNSLCDCEHFYFMSGWVCVIEGRQSLDRKSVGIICNNIFDRDGFEDNIVGDQWLCKR